MTRSEHNKRHYEKHKDSILAHQRNKYWNAQKTVLIEGPDKSMGIDVVKLIQADLSVTELMIYLFMNLNKHTRAHRDLKKLNIQGCAEVLGLPVIRLSRLQNKAKSILAQ